MKEALIAQKRFLHDAIVLAVGALFYAHKSVARELIATGLARQATAEELQAAQGIDGEQGNDADGGDAVDGEPAADEVAEKTPENEPAKEKQEQDNDADGGDAGASEESPAPVPKRRGRKSAS